ncbi:hypothetical protein COCON_G00041700 [Conger conger]|uniref:Uncharacterized protein n=1 Tax=Conger conger TaxID=82655 RepID=A0A9Q1DTV4_CONCO|nr:hypothetical protein COCON_G00041700 [Conger conger]
MKLSAGTRTLRNAASLGMSWEAVREDLTDGSLRPAGPHRSDIDQRDENPSSSSLATKAEKGRREHSYFMPSSDRVRKGGAERGSAYMIQTGTMTVETMPQFHPAGKLLHPHPHPKKRPTLPHRLFYNFTFLNLHLPLFFFVCLFVCLFF